MISAHSWFYWALLSAIFAAMTAIFAKIGLEGVDSDYATLILCDHTGAGRLRIFHREMERPVRAQPENLGVLVAVGTGHRRVLGLLFSRAAIGGSLQSRAGRQVQLGAGRDLCRYLP